METKIYCPKCGSDQITATKHGFSGKKAFAGAVLTGGIGLLAGMHGSKKIDIICLSCGNKFKPGQGRKSPIISPPKKHLNEAQIIEIEENTLRLLKNRSILDATNYYAEQTGLAPMNINDKIKRIAETNSLLLPKISSMKAYDIKEEEEMHKSEHHIEKKASIGCFIVGGILLLILFFIIRSCV